ncbi:hypothetical protein HanHA300_Chr03g0081891 [Helianthus annuus]|nr:hypothetical protein HanHA300_Chr03g0081891 [Helianthus annuus]KAJ0607166.1 hypothetical protein HanHA89_Chr03g0093331 [Helianthus annuus]KAJ0767225.1 hypothetical protein HanLR1_Chr03g0086621 [Helianthus annuus]KAJ0773073.1 hypothetical protein HanOQP8_Chr03g0094671 [Helianthus annuus]
MTVIPERRNFDTEIDRPPNRSSHPNRSSTRPPQRDYKRHGASPRSLLHLLIVTVMVDTLLLFKDHLNFSI